MSDSDGLPDRIKLSGGAFNSAFPGNGIFFRHDAIEEMAEEEMPGGQFVANHDRDISALAGTVTSVDPRRISVKERRYKETEDGKELDEEVAVEATHVRFDAHLSREYPAYEQVAESMLARARNGQIPNISIALWGNGLEEEDGKLFLSPPYTYMHLGHVDHGAQKPNQGVGVDDIQAMQLDLAADAPKVTATLEAEDGTSTEIECRAQPVIMNLRSLARDYDGDLSEHLEEELDLKVPENPSGGSGVGKEGEWSAPSLSDFTDEDWGELSGSEKNTIAKHFADATGSWSENFDDDVNLPHHDPSDGEAVLNGARNALSRLPQTENLHSSEDAIQSHLNAHLPDEEEEAAWAAYLAGKMTLEEVVGRFDFTLPEIGLFEEEYAEEFGVALGVDDIEEYRAWYPQSHNFTGADVDDLPDLDPDSESVVDVIIDDRGRVKDIAGEPLRDSDGESRDVNLADEGDVNNVTDDDPERNNGNEPAPNNGDEPDKDQLLEKVSTLQEKVDELTDAEEKREELRLRERREELADEFGITLDKLENFETEAELDAAEQVLRDMDWSPLNQNDAWGDVELDPGEEREKEREEWLEEHQEFVI